MFHPPTPLPPSLPATRGGVVVRVRCEKEGGGGVAHSCSQATHRQQYRLDTSYNNSGGGGSFNHSFQYVQFVAPKPILAYL